MTCPKCNFQNLEGEFICQQCRAVLAVPTPPVVPLSVPAELQVTTNPLKKWLWVWVGVAGLILILVVAMVIAIKPKSGFSSPDLLPEFNLTESSVTQAPKTKYDIDSDSDGVPNDIETAIGTNPNRQECSEYLDNPCGLVTISASGTNTTKNILIILDSSGSMAEEIGGKSKMEIAKGVLGDYLKTLMEKGFKVGLMVYGHKGSNSAKDKAVSCAGIETVLPIGGQASEITSTLAGFSPTGWTPIGGALIQAKDVLSGFTGQDNYVLLVSDGEETCGGDPVATSKSLKESNIKAVVNVIGFNVDSKTRSQLETIARVGGGKFIFSSDENSFRQANEEITAGMANLWSGRDALVCILGEEHKLLSCLNNFYYSQAKPKMKIKAEMDLLSIKHKEITDKFRAIVKPFEASIQKQLEENSAKVQDAVKKKFGQ